MLLRSHLKNWPVAGTVIVGFAVVTASVALAQPQHLAHDPTTPEGVRLVKIDNLRGTVVADGDDPRFDHSVDLVIETPRQMVKHEQQFIDHPDWFEGVDIGVAYAESASAPGPNDDNNPDGEFEPSACAQDLGDPEDEDVRWVSCIGAGDSAAYRIPLTGQPARRMSLSGQRLAVREPVQPQYAALGYFAPGTNVPAFDIDLTSSDASSRLTISLLAPDTSDTSDFAPTGGLDYTNALLATALAADFTTVEILLDGSCPDLATWAGYSDCVLTTADLQPKWSN